MAKSTCPSPDELSAYLFGHLPEPAAREIETHLETCAECDTLATQLESGSRDTLLNGMRQSHPSAEDDVVSDALGEAPASLSAEQWDSLANSRSDVLPPPPWRFGVYELLGDEIGAGNLGSVYKARHTTMDRIVAIKVVKANRTASPEATARFAIEIKAVARMDHPNIVKAYDAGKIEGRHFLAMEYVDGSDVNTISQRVGPLESADACELVRQAATGLQYAHDQGLVHRDIKPSNLMLTRDGVVKILDFGLARLSDLTPDESELTSTGGIVGTPAYMSPEQATDSHSVDMRADLYSLGCTLYRLLTGVTPFMGPGYHTAYLQVEAHREQRVPPVRERRPELPRRLAAIVDRLLAKDPSQRFATAAEVAEALAPFAKGSDLRPLVADAAQTEVKPARRPPRRWLGIATAAAALAGAILLGIIIKIRTKDGQEITMNVPGDANVSVEHDGKTLLTIPSADAGKAAVPAQSATRAQPDGSSAPLPPPTGESGFATGAPIGQNALVMGPAVLPGVKTWTIETREDTGLVRVLAFSPDGKWLASAGSDGVIRIRTSETGEVVRMFRSLNGELHNLAWSPDGQFLASSGWDGGGGGALEVWNIAKACLTYSDLDAAFKLAWSPDSKSLIYGGHHYCCGVLDVSSNNNKPNWVNYYYEHGFKEWLDRVQVVEDNKPAWVNSACQGSFLWSADSRMFLAVCTAEGRSELRWHDKQTGQPLETVVPLNGVLESMLLPDGKLLAMMSIPDADSEKVCLFDPDAGQVLREQASPVHRPNRPMRNGGSLSPDGRLCAECTNEELCVWETETGTPLMKVPTPEGSWGFAWAPDARVIAYAGCESIVALEVPSGNTIFERRQLLRHPWRIETAALSPDGSSMVIGFCDKTCVFRLTDASSTLASIPLTVCDPEGSGVLWSPSGKKIAIAGQGQLTIRSSDLQTRYATFEEPVPGMCMHPSAWSADEKQLAIGTRGGGVLIYTEGRDELDSFSGPAGSGMLPTWSPQRDMLATIGLNGTINLWDAVTKQISRSVEAHAAICANWRGDVRHAGAPVWSPDGRFLAVVSDETRTVTLVEVASGEVWPLPLETPAGYGSELVFSPDGQLLAAAFESGVVVWDTPTKQRVTKLPPVGPAARVAFSGDSERLFALCCGPRRFVSEVGMEFRDMRPTIPGPFVLFGQSGCVDWSRDADIGCCTVRRITNYQGGKDFVCLWRLSTGASLGTISFVKDAVLFVNGEGHYRSSTPIDDDLVYLVQTEQGQETLSAAEFSQRYGWQNDPSRVVLASSTTAAKPAAPLAKPTEPDNALAGTASEPKTLTPAPLVIPPERPETEVGEPLSSEAFVQQPARIPGVRSWTIETRGTRGGVPSLQVAPDGQLVASGGLDGSARLWEMSTGRLVRVLVGTTDRIKTIAWSPDGTMLAVCAGNQVALWDAIHGKRLLVLESKLPLRSMAWSPDGQRLATGAESDAEVLVWDVDSATIQTTLHVQPEGGAHIWGLAWLPDGGRMLIGHGDGHLDLWDIGNDKSLCSVAADAWLLVTPDATHVLTGPARTGGDKPLLWQIGPDRLDVPQEVAASFFSRYTVAFAGDVHHAVWGVNTGAVVGIVSGDLSTGGSTPVTNDSGPVYGLSTHDGKQIAYTSGAGDVAVVDSSSGHIIWQVACHYMPAVEVSWSPDGRALAIGHGGQDQRSVRLYSLVSGGLDWQPDNPFWWRHSPSGQSLAWSPHRNTFLACSGDGGGSAWVNIWDYGTRSLVGKLETNPATIVPSPDGQFVATGGTHVNSGKVEFWSADTLAKHRDYALSNNQSQAMSVAFSPDGSVLAISTSQTIELLATDSGQRLRIIEGIGPTAMSFSPDGTLLATPGALFDVETGACLTEFMGQPGAATVTWLRDGTTVVTGANDGTLRFWDAVTGISQRVVTAPLCAVLSPDESLMAGLRKVGPVWRENAETVVISDARTGRVLRSIVGLRDGKYLTLTPDGHYVSSPKIERDIVYVVETDAGQETLTPEEFSQRYGWQNDPSRVQLAP